MNIVVGVISPARIWVMPRRFVDDLRQSFPHQTFLDAWDRDALRRLLPLRMPRSRRSSIAMCFRPRHAFVGCRVRLRVWAV